MIEYSENPDAANKAKPKMWCPVHYWPFYGDCVTCTQIRIRDALEVLVAKFRGDL